MAVARMRKIHMAVLESHKERLVTFLQDQGCLEISGSEKSGL